MDHRARDGGLMTAPARPYRDRWGHRHSQAVYDHWHPRVIEFTGIHKARRTKSEIAEDEAACARNQLRDF